ncbi:septum formation initiator family protein [Patescibacteria group bacterium]|nr:septum formation initiator family protein [Patescibacteria group bacterium]
MNRHRTRKHKHPFFHSWFFLVPLAIVFGFFVKSAYSSFVKKRTADREREKYEQRLRELEEKKADLEAKINKLETERGLEDEFRTRFDVVKEGETVIRIVEEE